MSRRSNLGKRAAQKRRHAQRPKQVDKPIAHVAKTAGLIAELARPIHAIAFAEAIKEVQLPTNT